MNLTHKDWTIWSFGALWYIALLRIADQRLTFEPATNALLVYITLFVWISVLSLYVKNK